MSIWVLLTIVFVIIQFISLSYELPQQILDLSNFFLLLISLKFLYWCYKRLKDRYK